MGKENIKFNLAEKFKFVLGRVENRVRKGENAGEISYPTKTSLAHMKYDSYSEFLHSKVSHITN